MPPAAATGCDDPANRLWFLNSMIVSPWTTSYQVKVVFRFASGLDSNVSYGHYLNEYSVAQYLVLLSRAIYPASTDRDV